MFDDYSLLALTLTNMLGIAGIVVWHLQGRKRPTARLVVQILFFAGMTVLLCLAGVSPILADGSESGIGGFLAKSGRVLWWTHLAWAIIGVMNIYIALNRRPREAHLLQDLIVALAYIGVALAIMGFVFGAPVGTIVATSGVVAVILGLALQNTLGDVFSGIALTLGRPYAIGDWIMLGDGTEGRVTGTNWRATNLLTGANNIVVLPNSVLARQGLTNLSRPDETHEITQAVRIAATQMPSFVEEVMRAVLDDCQRIVQDPPPVVALKAADAVAIEIELQFRVASASLRTSARNEVIDRLSRHCRANGFDLA
ncbi:membrane protein [Labrys miyagiensis]